MIASLKIPGFSWKYLFSPLHSITVGIVFVADQVSKYLVNTYIEIGEKWELMPFVNLIHIKNRGAAFGMFHHSSQAFRLVFFGLVTVVCLYLLIHWLMAAKKEEYLQRFSLSLILGGALGNLVDRAVFGEVTDFVDAYYGDYHWYTFNIADAGITVGVSLIFWMMLPLRKKKQVS